ncbi:hypothetical protein [Gilliamella sp. BG7]|uniref:hypothetical protein n=1 Tax=unclassified Gilliamella TaxID=2685620 RepID=UPI0039867749
MTTLTINKYDLANRFGMGDEFSKNFVSNLFEKYADVLFVPKVSIDIVDFNKTVRMRTVIFFQCISFKVRKYQNLRK